MMVPKKEDDEELSIGCAAEERKRKAVDTATAVKPTKKQKRRLPLPSWLEPLLTMENH